MAVTKQQIDDLTSAIKTLTENIKNGTEKIPQYIKNNEGKIVNIGNKSDTENPFNPTERAKYIKENEISKMEYRVNELQGKFDSLKGKKGAGVELSRKRISEEIERTKNGGFTDKEAKLEKFNKGANAINAIINTIQGAYDIFLAWRQRDLEVSIAKTDYNAKISELSLERQTAIMNTGVKNLVGGFSKPASELAYANVESAQEMAKTSAITRQQEKIAAKRRDVATDKATAKAVGTTIAAAAGIGAALGSIIPGIGTAVGAAIGGLVGLVGHIFSKEAELDIQEKEAQIKINEEVSKQTQQTVDEFKKYTKSFQDFHKEVSDYVLKVDETARKFGVTIGYTSDTFSKSVTNIANAKVNGDKTLVGLFGEEATKLTEYLGNYMEESGRQVNFSAEDYGNVMGTARLFGMSGSESAQLYGSMNIFNASISSASDSMGTIYQQITKMGLSSKKFGKDLVQNLKLAEKYNFRGGVDNMMKITKWAMQTRFNLNSAANFSSQLQDATLSEALEKSAKLQVLGGSAAMNADPFGMLYDAWNDTGDMAKRMSRMFKGLTGRFDKKTGDVNFGIETSKMIAETAKALGMDPAEARNMLRQQVHQKEIDKVLSGMNEEDRLAIGNRATWDAKNQRWVVTDIHNQTHDITEYANGQADINEIRSLETDKAILDVVTESLSVQEKQLNVMTGNKTGMAEEKRGKVLETTNKEADLVEKTYKENWGQMSKAFDMVNQNTLATFEQSMALTETIANNIGTLALILNGFLNETIKNTKNFTSSEFMVRAYKFNNDELEAYINNKIIKNTDFEKDMRMEEKNKKTTILNNDGYGYTKGGVISGATNVKSINDGAVNVKTNNRDQYLAAMPNGPIDKILQQLIPGLQALLNNKNSNNGNNTLTLNGRIELSQDGSTVNLVEMLKNDPSSANKLITLLTKMVETNKSGKPTYSYKMF